MKSIKLTVIIDNNSNREDASSEHGLCLHLQSGNQVALFDTGRSDLVVSNLKALALDHISPLWIAFSHGHYDHTTGTQALLTLFPQTKLCYHPALTEPKWVLDPGEQWRYGGIPSSFHEIPPDRHHSTNQSFELIPGIWTSGSIAGDFARSFVRNRFFRNSAGHTVTDTFPDEQVLFVITEKGLSIISGCMHTGLEATLHKAKERFPETPFYALIGGLHLEGVSEARFAEILGILRENQFQKIMPLHCTGQSFVDYLTVHAPEIMEHGSVGVSIEI